MTGARVEVRGADTLARTLRGLADDLTHLTDAHTAAGAAVLAATRPRTRRKSGRLAASWTASVTADGVTIGSAVPYAGVQEYGSPRRRITPSRALAGGLDSAAGKVETIYFTAVDTAVGKVRGA